MPCRPWWRLTIWSVARMMRMTATGSCCAGARASSPASESSSPCRAWGHRRGCGRASAGSGSRRRRSWTRLRPKSGEIGRSAAMVPVETQQSQGFARNRGSCRPKTGWRAGPPQPECRKQKFQKNGQRSAGFLYLALRLPCPFCPSCRECSQATPCLTAHRKRTKSAWRRNAHGASPLLARATNMPPSCGS